MGTHTLVLTEVLTPGVGSPSAYVCRDTGNVALCTFVSCALGCASMPRSRLSCYRMLCVVREHLGRESFPRCGYISCWPTIALLTFVLLIMVTSIMTRPGVSPCETLDYAFVSKPRGRAKPLAEPAGNRTLCHKDRMYDHGRDVDDLRITFVGRGGPDSRATSPPAKCSLGKESFVSRLEPATAPG